MVFAGCSVTCGDVGTGGATAPAGHRATEAGRSGPPSGLCTLSPEERRRQDEQWGLQATGSSLRPQGSEAGPASLGKEEVTSLHNSSRTRVGDRGCSSRYNVNSSSAGVPQRGRAVTPHSRLVRRNYFQGLRGLFPRSPSQSEAHHGCSLFGESAHVLGQGLPLGTDVGAGSSPGHCGVWNSIPGPHHSMPGAPLPQVTTTQNVFRHA